MWMTSNSRADRRRIATIVGVLLLAARGTAFAQQAAPDMPRPALPQAAKVKPGFTEGYRAPVELESVQVRKVNEERAKLAGKEFMQRASNPLYLEVRTRAPLGNLERSAAPVILLNNEPLLNTRPVGQNRLIAFLPNSEKLKETNSVAVVWLGDRHTRSKRPLTFQREEVR
jgi:hypothetical protein